MSRFEKYALKGSDAFMNRTTALTAIVLIVLFLCTAGCSPTPRVAASVIGYGLDLPITQFETKGEHLRSESGHGLKVEVWANEDWNKYKPNLELELDGAAKVCKALSQSYPVRDWDYIDVYYFNRFYHYKDPICLVGVARVIIRRDTLKMLEDKDVPLSDYPKHWRFVFGFKDQLNSKKALAWYPDNTNDENDKQDQ